jgi:hypothetical protein
MTYSEEQKLILAGFLIGVVFTLVGFYMLKPEAPKQPVASKSNFEVVDTYKGCDVLKWGNGNLAEYKYLLYCKG